MIVDQDEMVERNVMITRIHGVPMVGDGGSWNWEVDHVRPPDAGMANPTLASNLDTARTSISAPFQVILSDGRNVNHALTHQKRQLVLVVSEVCSGEFGT